MKNLVKRLNRRYRIWKEWRAGHYGVNWFHDVLVLLGLKKSHSFESFYKFEDFRLSCTEGMD